MYRQSRPKRRKPAHCKQNRPSEPKPLEHSEPILDLPHFIKILGPKHYGIFRNYIPSLITYTIATAIFSVYLMEWKAVLQYLPYYNGRYAEPEKEKKVAKTAAKEAEEE